VGSRTVSVTGLGSRISIVMACSQTATLNDTGSQVMATNANLPISQSKSTSKTKSKRKKQRVAKTAVITQPDELLRITLTHGDTVFLSGNGLEVNDHLSRDCVLGS
jgi:hypothetical protein